MRPRFSLGSGCLGLLRATYLKMAFKPPQPTLVKGHGTRAVVSSLLRAHTCYSKPWHQHELEGGITMLQKGHHALLFWSLEAAGTPPETFSIARGSDWSIFGIKAGLGVTSQHPFAAVCIALWCVNLQNDSVPVYKMASATEICPVTVHWPRVQCKQSLLFHLTLPFLICNCHNALCGRHK